MKFVHKFIEWVRHVDIPVISSERCVRFRGSTAFIVFTISCAVFTDIFLYGIIVPVVPFAFETRMGIPPDQVQMKVSQNLAIYSAGLIVGGLGFGYICDRLPIRRVPMLTGLILIIASTVILCLTKSMALFMVGRLLLGISGGVVWTVGLAIMADTAPKDKIAYLMGYTGIGLSLGIFLGPLLGGVIFEKAGYNAVWYLCFAILAFDVLLRLLMIEKKHLKRKLEKYERQAAATEDVEQQLQVPEVAAEDEAHTESKQAVSESEEQGGDTRPKIGKWKLPRIFILLKSIRVWNCLIQSTITAWIMTSFDSTLTIHLNRIFGFDSLQAGLVFIAIAVPAVLEPLAGYLSDRFGPRILVGVGYVMVAVFLILLRIPEENTVNDKVLLVALIALCGVALTAVFSPMLAELTNVVAQIDMENPGVLGAGRGFGQAYGLYNVAFSVGALVGPFVSGATMNHRGWGMTSLSLGIIAFIVSVPAFIFTGGNIFTKSKHKEVQASDAPAA